MKKRAYSVRPATEFDLTQVAFIEEKMIQPPWSQDQFREELSKKHSHFWVVTDDATDETVFAYIVFAFPAEQAHIQTIAVHPDHQRKGLATYLLRKVIHFSMAQKAESLILEVRSGNIPAIQLYQKLGFNILRTLKKFYPNGEDGYVMLYKVERTKISQDVEDMFEDDDGNGSQNLN